MDNIFLGSDKGKGKDKSGHKGKRGFYIALMLCAASIAAVGYFTNKDKLNPPSEKADVEKVATVISQAPTPIVTEKPKLTPVPTIVQQSVNDIGSSNIPKPVQAQKSIPVAAPPPTEEKLKLIKPVEGKISVPHSPDKLIYSKTYEDWRTHNGVDINAAPGSQVKAAADGVVEKVYNDNVMGIVIEIKHGSFRMVYSNLSSDSMVQVGKTVKQGDIISGVGSTAIAESLQENHLHFELWDKDKCIDPKKYLE